MQYRYRRSSGNEAFIAQCGCMVVIAIVNLTVGGWSINYLLEFFAGKVIPFGWAMLLGLFAGEVSIPVAVVIAVLRKFGIL